MTVKELKELLAKYSDDYLVVVPGYETGYDTPIISKCGEIEIIPNPSAREWDGKYQFAVGEPEAQKAVFLPRNSN